MKSPLLAAAAVTLTVLLLATAPAGAQAPALRSGPGVQAGQDAGEAAVLAQCRHAPPPPPARPAGAPPPTAGVPAARDYKVTAIKGVVAAGKRWSVLWQGVGNNADGILSSNDGGVLIAQNDRSQVLKIDAQGKESVVFTDTHTGGALSRARNGTLFIAERQLNPAIWQLAPEHKLLANRIDGDPFDCIGGVLNDLQADSHGGVYFTYSGLFHAAANGTVTAYGENLRTNGLVLSPDEKTLYVTNGPSLVAFDVQADGSLTHQREQAKLEGGNGDGLAVDRAGRIYVTGGVGLWVVSPKGGVIGSIPTPYNIISVVFGGPKQSTLFAVVMTTGGDQRLVQVISIPTLTSGVPGRNK